MSYLTVNNVHSLDVTVAGHLSVSEPVLNGYMAQLNLAEPITVLDLRQLIRNRVLGQTVKTVKTKSQRPQIKLRLPVQDRKQHIIQPQHIPANSPFGKRSEVRQKALDS